MAKAKVLFSETQSSKEFTDPLSSLLTPLQESLKTEQEGQAAFELLSSKGGALLLRGDKSGLRYFDMALRLSPYTAHLYFEQGLSLLEYGVEHQDKSILVLAARRLKKLSHLDPENWTGHLARAEALYQLGRLTGDISFIRDSESVCSALPKDRLTKEEQIDLATLLGRLHFALAKKSGEPGDVHKACTHFEKAFSLEENLELDVHEATIEAYLTLHTLSQDATWLIKALLGAKKALSYYPDSSELYRYLGKGLSAKHLSSHSEDHAEQASCFFLKSLQLEPFAKTVYVEAMRHAIDSFQIHNEPSYLSSACHLYDKGSKHLSSARALLPLYVEAKALLGLSKGDLNMIKSALTLMEEAMDEAEDDTFFADDSKAMGICHWVQGRYFQDCDLIYQGIEYFQVALSSDRSRQDLWALMASSYKIAFELALDEVDFDTGVKFYKKAMKFGTCTSLQSEYASLLLTCFDTFGEETILKESLAYFDAAIKGQPNAKYVHPNWLFEYAKALDLASDFDESEKGLVLSIKLLKDIYALNSNHPGLFHQLALSVHHLGSLMLDSKLIESALHYFKLGHLKDKENGDLLIDWAAALLSGLETVEGTPEVAVYEEEAHQKITKGIELGAMQGYYLLACLYAYKKELDLAFFYITKAHQFDTLPALFELEDESFLEPLMATDKMNDFLDQIGWKSGE